MAAVKELLIVPVRKVTNENQKYRPSSYEVGVIETQQGGELAGSSSTHTSFKFLSHKPSEGQQPLASTLLLYQEHPKYEDDSSIIQHLLKEQYGMESLSVHVLACSCSTAQDSNHTLNLLYLVPTIYGSDGAASVAAGSSNIEFVNLEDLVEQPGQLMNRSDRERLLVIDQWLCERHLIPTIDMNLLFSSKFSGVGVVQSVLSNPLRDAPVPPKEQHLVISFNNPVFPDAKT